MSIPPKVRPALPADKLAMITAVAASGLFPPDVDWMDALLDAYVNGTLGDGHCGITTHAGSDLVGVAYYAPERMTVGTWNTYLIAVQVDQQGYGHVQTYFLKQIIGIVSVVDMPPGKSVGFGHYGHREAGDPVVLCSSTAKL